MVTLMQKLQATSKGRLLIQINSVSDEKITRLLTEPKETASVGEEQGEGEGKVKEREKETESVVSSSTKHNVTASSNDKPTASDRRLQKKRSYKVKTFTQVKSEQHEMDHLANWVANVRYGTDISMPQGVRSFRIDDHVCLPHNEKHRKLILDKVKNNEEDVNFSLNFQPVRGKPINRYAVSAVSSQHPEKALGVTITYFTGPKDQPAQVHCNYHVKCTSGSDHQTTDVTTDVTTTSSSDWSTQMENKPVYSAILNSFSGHD